MKAAADAGAGNVQLRIMQRLVSGNVQDGKLPDAKYSFRSLLDSEACVFIRLRSSDRIPRQLLLVTSFHRLRDSISFVRIRKNMTPGLAFCKTSDIHHMAAMSQHRLAN